MKLSELADWCGGVLHGEDREFDGFSADSRSVKAGELFLCAVGANVDGHDFVDGALARGAAGSLATRAVGEPYVLVEDVLKAVKRFGERGRARFEGPVVGITGSNGKTSTKEFTAGALAAIGPVVKSEGNQNTEYTSPLLWSRVGLDTKSVVVEMGMRGFGQISYLAGIARPTVGVVTNIGTAHIEKVGSREGIVRAKGELLQSLPKDGVGVLWAEDEYLADLAGMVSGTVRTFGFSPEAWSRVTGYRADGWAGSVVLGEVDGEPYEVRLATLGRHQALNVAAAMAVGKVLGADLALAAKGVEGVSAMPMRMEVRVLSGVTYLVDTYNASPDSTTAALKTLETGPATGRRMAVLGEMKELGDFTEGGHRLVGKVVGVSSLDRVLFVGAPMKFAMEEALAAGFPSSRVSFVEAVDLGVVGEFLGSAEEGDAVLIKGSRALGLEKALEGLG